MFLTLVGFSLMIAPSHASMSVIKGTVYWYDQYGNLRPLAWAQVTATSEDGVQTLASSTTDGTYIMWVAPGTYEVSVTKDPSLIPESHTVTVPDGGVAAVDFQLEPSGKPIPEYPPSFQPLMLVVAALAAVTMIRWRRRIVSAAS